jgi:hypothetical protein
LTNRLVIATPGMFGARRAEQQPRRLRSPKKSTASFRLKAELQTGGPARSVGIRNMAVDSFI